MSSKNIMTFGPQFFEKYQGDGNNMIKTEILPEDNKPTSHIVYIRVNHRDPSQLYYPYIENVQLSIGRGVRTFFSMLCKETLISILLSFVRPKPLSD